MSETIVEANVFQNTPTASDLDAAIAADEAARLVGDNTDHQPDDAEPAAPGGGGKEPPPEETETSEEPERDDGEFEKRISRLAFEKRQAEKRARELQQRLDRTEGKAPPLDKDEEVARLVEQRAAELADLHAYNAKANEVYKAGCETYPDFDQRLANFRDLGGISREVVEAADEAGDAHKIIHWLSRNLDEAERIMKMSPHRMGAALAKINAKVNAPKPQTKAPAPIKPIQGQAKSEPSMDDMPIDEWMRREDERMSTRRWGRH